MTTNRTPAGVPTGGQFAASARAEAAADLLPAPSTGKGVDYYWNANATAADLPEGLTRPDDDAPIVTTTGQHLSGGDTIWMTGESGQIEEFKVLESIPDAGYWGVPLTYLIRDQAGHEDEYTFDGDDEVIAHRGDGTPEWFEQFHAGGNWYWTDDEDDEDDEDDPF